jgi:hypothetical protein
MRHKLATTAGSIAQRISGVLRLVTALVFNAHATVCAPILTTWAVWYNWVMITSDQIESAKSGREVVLHLEGVDLVLLRRDLLEQLKHDYDHGDWTDEELHELAARTFEDADDAGPIP